MVGKVTLRASVLGLVVLSVIACRHASGVRESVLPGVAASERCALVEAIIQHSADDPDDPNAHRVPLMDDQCARMAAGWQGRLLVEVKAMPSDRNLFSRGESCPMFWPFPTDGMDAANLPTFALLVELTPDGADSYSSHIWFRGIADPKLGTCSAEDGRVERRTGKWTAVDSPPSHRP
jgi:hypothetical protein